MLASVKIYGR